MMKTQIQSDTPRAHADHRPVVVGLVLLGCALRLGLALPEHTPLAEPDTIVGGLTALEVLRGETPVFNVGYRNGSVEAHLIAALFWIFGTSRATLALGPAFFSMATMGVWYLFYRATLDRRTAVWALAIIAVPSSGFLFWTSLANTYSATLFLCAAILWTATWVASDDSCAGRSGGLGRALCFGLAVGLGWWSSPLTLTCTLPAVVWLGLRDPKILLRVYRLAAFAVGAALGAAPWILFNLNYGLPSLRRSVATRPVRGLQETFDAGLHLLTSKLPGLLANTDRSVRPDLADSVAWLAAPALLLHLVATGVFVWIVWRSRRRGSDDLPRMAWGVPWLLLMVVGMTVALNLVSSASLRPGPTARYILPLYLAVPGILAIFLRWLAVRRRVAAVVIVAALLLFHVMGAFLPWTHERVWRQSQSTLDDQLVETLENEGVEVVLGDYFAVYPINFNSRLRVLGVPLIPRHDHKKVAIRLSGEKRFALLALRSRERSFRRWIESSGLEGRWVEAGKRSVVFVVREPQPAQHFIAVVRSSVKVQF